MGWEHRMLNPLKEQWSRKPGAEPLGIGRRGGRLSRRWLGGLGGYSHQLGDNWRGCLGPRLLSTWSRPWQSIGHSGNISIDSAYWTPLNAPTAERLWIARSPPSAGFLLARRTFIDMMEGIMVGKEIAKRERQQAARTTGAAAKEVKAGVASPER